MDRVGTTRVAIALGSNLGDRRGHFAWVLGELERILAGLQVSTIRETEPVGVPGTQPPFLNAVVVGETALSAQVLLANLLELERLRGRERPYRWAPRTLDLDLILYGDGVLESRGLTVPHPRFRERRFVLEPLAELAPAWLDPVTGKTVAELLAEMA